MKCPKCGFVSDEDQQEMELIEQILSICAQGKSKKLYELCPEAKKLNPFYDEKQHKEMTKVSEMIEDYQPCKKCGKKHFDVNIKEQTYDVFCNGCKSHTLKITKLNGDYDIKVLA